MCVHLNIQNKYTQYIHIKKLILDAVNHDSLFDSTYIYV